MIDLFDQMHLSNITCKFDVHLAKIKQKILDLPNYDSPVKATSELILSYQPSGANFYDWFIADNKTSVEISFGRAMLAEWRQAVTDVKMGKGDFSIGLNEDHSIFFWSIR